MQPDLNNPIQPSGGVPVPPQPQPLAPQPLAPQPLTPPAETPPLAPAVQPVPLAAPIPDPVVVPPVQVVPSAPPAPELPQLQTVAQPQPVAVPAPQASPQLPATPQSLAASVPLATPAVAAMPQPESAPQPVVLPTQPAVQSASPEQPLPAADSAPLAIPSASPTPASSSKGKVFKIVGAVVGAVVLVVVLIGAVVALTSGKPIAYKASDLTSVTTKNYTAKYAKQWTDLSTNNSVLKYLKTSLGSETSLVDQKIYGYKYDTKTGQNQTLLLIADTPIGVSDAELKQGLTDPSAKQQFEASFKGLTSALDSDKSCQSITGKNETTAYNTAKYLVEVKADIDCNYTKSSQVKYGTKSIHQVVFLGIKNGNTYIATLKASRDDWAKNGAFYNANILNSISPK